MSVACSFLYLSSRAAPSQGGCAWLAGQPGKPPLSAPPWEILRLPGVAAPRTPETAQSEPVRAWRPPLGREFSEKIVCLFHSQYTIWFSTSLKVRFSHCLISWDLQIVHPDFRFYRPGSIHGFLSYFPKSSPRLPSLSHPHLVYLSCFPLLPFKS